MDVSNITYQDSEAFIAVLPRVNATWPFGPDVSLNATITDMDDTLEQTKPSSNFDTSSTRDEDREQDSSGDEDGGLDWTKLPYVHFLTLIKFV